MEREQRMKAMETAAAEAATNHFVPAAVRVGIAAMVEELREQRARLDAVELAIFGGSDGKNGR